jgi:hypothetical protein
MHFLKIFRFRLLKSRWFEQLGYNLADLLVQHHGVDSDLAFWNQTLHFQVTHTAQAHKLYYNAMP